MEPTTIATKGANFLLKRFVLHNPGLLGGAIGGTIGLFIGATTVHGVIRWYSKKYQKQGLHEDIEEKKYKTEERVKNIGMVIANISLHAGGAVGGIIIGTSVGSVVGIWVAFSYKAFSTIRTLLKGYSKIKLNNEQTAVDLQ